MTCKNLNSSWETLSIEKDNKEQELMQRLTMDHESEINEYKRLIEIKEEEIRSLRVENLSLEARLKDSLEKTCVIIKEHKLQEQHLCEDIKAKDKLIQQLNAENEKAIKDLTEKLNREHKTEIENIRSRFRLMMDRSPSDPCVEEPAIKQMKEQFERQMKIAVDEAVSQESKKWQKKLEEVQEKYEEMMESCTKKIVEEKERQIDLLRERENNLVLECTKYKTTIQQLAECESQSQVGELLDKVECLEKEKGLLQAELQKSRNLESSRMFESTPDLGVSVAVLEGNYSKIFFRLFKKNTFLNQYFIAVSNIILLIIQ